MKTIRIPLLLVLTLTSSANHVCAQNPNKTTTSQDRSQSIEPKLLWTKTAEEMVSPIKTSHASFCGIASDGKFLFEFKLPITEQQGLRLGFVLLDPTTGSTLQTIQTAPPRKGTGEWTSESRWLPDGRYLRIGHTFNNQLAGVNFRVIDTKLGKATERLIAFDNPSQDGLSNEPVHWIGMVTTKCRMTGDVFRLRNNQFLADLDASSLKTIRFIKAPEQGRILIDAPLKNGCTWHFQIQTPNQPDKILYTEFDKPAKMVSADEAKKLHEEQSITEVAHPRAFNPVRLETSKVESKLKINFPRSKSIEVDVGKANSDASVYAHKCGEFLIVNVISKSEGTSHTVYSLNLN